MGTLATATESGGGTMEDPKKSTSDAESAITEPEKNALEKLIRRLIPVLLKEQESTDYITKEEANALIQQRFSEQVNQDEKPDQNVKVTMEVAMDETKNLLIIENMRMLGNRIALLEKAFTRVTRQIVEQPGKEHRKFKLIQNKESKPKEKPTKPMKRDLPHSLPSITEEEPLPKYFEPEEPYGLSFPVNGKMLDAYGFPVGPTPREADAMVDLNPTAPPRRPNHQGYQMLHDMVQYRYNLLMYKKSDFSMDLNRRVYLNPNVRPINMPPVKPRASKNAQFIT